MNFAILTIVVLYTIALAFTIKKRKKEDAEKEKAFWDREHDANFSRKKSIADLDYVTIPEDIIKIAKDSSSLKMKIDSENVDNTPANVAVNNDESSMDIDEPVNNPIYENADTHCQIIAGLTNKKILNLNGITNTDLKLTYGAANLTELSACDQNYSDLIIALDHLGKILVDNNQVEDAIKIYEYSVSIGTDIASSYLNLADLYKSVAKKELIHVLIKNCENISSIRKNSIITHLNEKLDQ